MDDHRVREGFETLVDRDRRLSAELLAFIDEVDRRKLWAAAGSSSMFAFCVERFHMSESTAGKRIWAARTARRFPVLLDMIARGEIHLSGICVLAKHLTDENHRDVLARATHRSTLRCKELVAELAPQPDVRTRIVALPRRDAGKPGRDAAAETASLPWPPENTSVPSEHRQTGATILPPAAHHAPHALAPTPAAPTMHPAADALPPPHVVRAAAAGSPSPAPGHIAPGAIAARAAPTPGHVEWIAAGASAAPLVAPVPVTGRVSPLAPRRYKLELTMGQETRDKLTELQELLSHRIPDGDPGTIIDRALDVLLEQARAERTCATERPRAARSSGKRTRSVPAEVQREVWRRDAGQCAYVGSDRHRCEERRFLELHHRRPYARGGEHSVDNVELRCRAHNQLEADRDYGRAFMDGKRQPDLLRESPAPYLRLVNVPRGMPGADPRLAVRSALIEAIQAS